MADFSFDVESEYDKAEMNNVVDQVQREITNRYDFKNTSASLSWKSSDKDGLVIAGDTQFQIESIIDILRKKLALRGQSQQCIDVSGEIHTNNLRMRLEVPFVRGLDQAKAKLITTAVKEAFPKMKTQVQGETVRITSPKKDELQLAINLLKTKEFNFPIVFTNYR